MKTLFCLAFLIAVSAWFSAALASGIMIGVVFSIAASVVQLLTCKTL